MSKLDTILRLQIIDDIGGDEGKNSTVKKALDHQLNAHFAVKIIPKSKLIKDFGSDDENLFFTESKMLYQNQHPNIVKIQHASSCDENVYFSMPYYKSGSLNQLMNSRFLTVREIIKIALEFLSGIHFIHTNNLLHFDIKPTNILINDNGKAMISDFGLSRYTDDYGLSKYLYFYTSHYPPECIESNIATKQADIYQAGLTLYRMCNGNAYFKQQYEFLKSQGDEKLITAIKKETFPTRDYFPHIPVKLRKIINKALKSNPDDRYSTVLEMMNDISKIEESLDVKFNTDNSSYHCWNIDVSETSIDQVSIFLKDGTIISQGKKINKISGKEINISSLAKKGYKDYKEVFKVVEKYIKESN